MRGDDRHSAGLFSCIGPEERVPPDHPLRPIRDMVDMAVLCQSPVRTNQPLILDLSSEWWDRLEPRPPRPPTPAGEVFERLPPGLRSP
jgi:hypothetical protein